MVLVIATHLTRIRVVLGVGKEVKSMNNNEIDPFYELRSTIEESLTQFRNNNDTSTSLFHPSRGFVYAYDVDKTNKALERYEASIPTEYIEGTHTLTVSQKILMEANLIVSEHPDMDVRDFAREVAAYMLIHVPISRRLRSNPLKRLALVPGLIEKDTI
jgi:hypothetical protein